MKTEIIKKIRQKLEERKIEKIITSKLGKKEFQKLHKELGFGVFLRYETTEEKALDLIQQWEN